MKNIQVLTHVNGDRQIFIPAAVVEQLKQNAKKLKKETGIPHHEALERVAQKTGIFQNWHHVTLAAADSLPAEQAYYSGFCIAMDFSKYDSADFSDSPFLEDFRLHSLLEPDYRKWLEESIDPDEGVKNKDCWSSEELDEFVTEDLSDVVLLRYTGTHVPSSSEEAIALIMPRYSFWPPLFIRLRGELIDMYSVPATDDDGGIVGLRL